MQEEPISAASRPDWRRWSEQLAGLAILGGVGWYLWEHRHTIAQIVDVSGQQLALLAVGVLLTWIASAAQSYLMFRAQGTPIGFFENLVLGIASTFGNYLPMRLGTLVRVRYMKQIHGMRYVRYGSISGMRVVLMLSATGLLGLIGCLGLWWKQGDLSASLMALFGAVFLGSIVAFSIPLPRAQDRRGAVSRIWNDFVDGLAVSRQRPDMALQVAAFIMAQYALTGWRIGISLSAMSTEGSFFLLVLLGPVATLSSFLAITPGGLGLREALMGYVTFATGMSFQTGIVAGAIDRAVLLCLVLSIGSLSFGYVWWRIQKQGAAAGSDPAPGAPREPPSRL